MIVVATYPVSGWITGRIVCTEQVVVNSFRNTDKIDIWTHSLAVDFWIFLSCPWNRCGRYRKVGNPILSRILNTLFRMVASSVGILYLHEPRYIAGVLIRAFFRFSAGLKFAKIYNLFHPESRKFRLSFPRHAQIRFHTLFEIAPARLCIYSDCRSAGLSDDAFSIHLKTSRRFYIFYIFSYNFNITSKRAFVNLQISHKNWLK